MITNFTVEYINQPSGTYKASLKGIDQNGQPLKLSMGNHSLTPFQAGGSYLIDYERKTFQRDGKEIVFYAFNGLVDGGPVAYPAAAGPIPGTAGDNIEAQIEALKAKKEARDRAAKQQTAQISQHQHAEDLKAAHIFITGVVGRAAGNGLQAGELQAMALAAVAAWKAVEQALATDMKAPGISPETRALGGAPSSENRGAGGGAPSLDPEDIIPF